MKKHFFKLIPVAVIVIFSITYTFAQDNEVMARLKTYGIVEEHFTENLRDADPNYAVKLKTVMTLSDTSTTTLVADFDPSKPIGERWTLISQNGNPPNKTELKTFDKSYNTKKKGVNGKLDMESLKILKDDENYLVVYFEYEPKSIPKKYAVLRDCHGEAYINKQTKKLEKSKFINEVPVKVKIFHVDEYDFVVNYKHIPEDNTYVIDNEKLNMKATLFTMPFDIVETIDYYDYKRVTSK